MPLDKVDFGAVPESSVSFLIACLALIHSTVEYIIQEVCLCKEMGKCMEMLPSKKKKKSTEGAQGFLTLVGRILFAYSKTFS